MMNVNDYFKNDEYWSEHINKSLEEDFYGQMSTKLILIQKENVQTQDVELDNIQNSL